MKKFKIKRIMEIKKIKILNKEDFESFVDNSTQYQKFLETASKLFQVDICKK